MHVGSATQPRKTTLFGSRPSPAAISPVNQGKSTTNTNQSGKCCRGFHDCMTMGSVVSHNQHQHHQQSPSKLEQQVENLEKEVQRQRELMGLYKMRMERTQDYLRYCLEIAQDNGFLNLIISPNNNNKEEEDNQQQSPLSSAMSNLNSSSPPVPIPVQRHRDVDLAALIDKAKANGWCIEAHEIELHEKVGQGSTAEIYRGTWRGLGVAVKCIQPDFFHSNDKGVTFFAQEVETLSRQRHRFVLQLMGACLEPPDHGWVVTEFLSMTLKEWLHGPGNRRRERRVPVPPFEERLAKGLEIAQAMQYLHDQKPKLLHRDLKPSNIFLDDAMHVKVADFGHARFLSDDEKALTGETGTYVYMAPEIFRCMPYDEKSDVYSFSIILNELMTGEFPYIETAYGPSKIAMEVAEGRLRPALPEDDGQLGQLIDLIRLTWDENPFARPSFPTITCTLKSILNKFMETSSSN